MRHRAWLAAKPGKHAITRLAILKADEARGYERWELDPPRIEAAGHLVGHLFQVGPSTGGEVVTFQEIQSWVAQTGYVLNGWEVETLRRLSAAYLAEYSDAADEHRPPPSVPDDHPINHDDVAAKLSGILDQFERQDASMGLGEKALG